MKKFLLFIVVLICLIELTFRGFLYFNSTTKMLENDVYLYDKYYPNLAKLANYDYDQSKVNMLILGGSVVYQDTIPFKKNSIINAVTFCGFNELDKNTYNVLNLAYPAHTSLDSKIKFEILENLKFDYVFTYHGINDTRSNNVDSLNYEEDYGHIAFYDELGLLKRHPELKYFASLYMVDLFIFKVKTYFGFKEYTPKEFLQFLDENDKEISETYFNKECQYYTEKTFYDNMEELLSTAFKRGIKPVMLTYAFYQPEDYSLARFYKANLDYATNFFPTELYGDPDCVPLMIERHNNQILSLKAKYNDKVLFYDFNINLTKDQSNFMDICHLTNNGCSEMYEAVVALIQDKSTMELLNDKGLTD